MEIWRDIPAYSHYEVSSLGRVRTKPRRVHNYTKPPRILKQAVRRHRSRRVLCCTVNLVPDGGGSYQTARVHRLVLGAFVGPPPGGNEGCHDNGDATDNRLANLRWDSHAANMADQLRHGTRAKPPRYMGETHPSARLSDAEVMAIRAQPPGNAAALAWHYGVSRKTIYRIKRGEVRLIG